MRVLISGGHGYVGNFIAQHLAQTGFQIVLGGRRPRAQSGEAFVTLELDADKDQNAAFHNIDIFIHAGFDHIRGKYRGGEGGDPDGFIAKNYHGTNALFDQAKAAGVSRTIFMSSRAVYDGFAPGTELFEHLKCDPTSLYGQVKLGSEQYLKTLCDANFCGTSLRVTGVFGVPYDGTHPLNTIFPDDPQFLPTQVQHMLQNLRQGHKWVDLFGAYLAGEPIEPRVGSEIHGTELAKIIRLMISAQPGKISGQNFNVAQVMVDYHDLLAAVQQQTGAQFPVPPRADMVNFNQMNLDRLMQIFG